MIPVPPTAESLPVSRFGPIRCVAFDVGGTLLRPNPPVGEVYAAAAARRGVFLSPQVLQERFARGFAARADDPRTSEEIERRCWRELVAVAFEDESLAIDCFEELYENFARPDAWEMFPDVPPALAQLRDAGIEIALASNFDARLHSVCAGFEFLRDIRPRVISSEAGWRKPHPEFYRRLTAAAGCAPEQILMVGDDFAQDVAAARDAGLWAVHLDRRWPPSVPRPPGAIGSLAELAPLLP